MHAPVIYHHQITIINLSFLVTTHLKVRYCVNSDNAQMPANTGQLNVIHHFYEVMNDDLLNLSFVRCYVLLLKFKLRCQFKILRQDDLSF